MVTTGAPGRIHVAEGIYGRLKEEFVFEPRGDTEVKGKGTMRTYFLTAKK